MKITATMMLPAAALLACAGCYMSTGASFSMDAGRDLPADDDPGEENPAPVCGNGVLEPGEECDDGNTEPLDGCDAHCLVEDCIPSTEICNGLDDDCDGLIDEGGVCGCESPDDLEILNFETVPGPGDAADPSIAWNGTEYGVVWTEGFARVDRGGRVIETRPSFGLMGSPAADVFWSEPLGRFVFCWSSMADVICGTQEPGPGEPESHTVIDAGPSGVSYNNPRTAWNAARGEMGLFHPISGIYGNQTYILERVAIPAFEPAEEWTTVNEYDGLSIYHSAAAWTGEMYAFLYAAPEGAVILSLFRPGGERLGDNILVDRIDSLEYLGRTLLWDGSMFGTAASDFSNLFFLRFNDEGELRSRVQLTDYEPGTLVYMPVLSAGPWDALVWYDLADRYRIWFNVVDEEGNALREPLLLSEQGIYPWIATDGESYLTAWREGDIWNPEIAIARIGCR